MVYKTRKVPQYQLVWLCVCGIDVSKNNKSQISYRNEILKKTALMIVFVIFSVYQELLI